MEEQQQNVLELPWFHPNLTRHQAEALLIQNATDGAYLLRESTSGGTHFLELKCTEIFLRVSLKTRAKVWKNVSFRGARN